MSGKRERAGNVLVISGFLMIAVSLVISCCNIYVSEEAGKISEVAVSGFLEYAEKVKAEKSRIPEIAGIYSGSGSQSEGMNKNEVTEEAVYESEGFGFLSVISVPVLGAELPVCSDFSMENLRYYPCRYSGTVSENNLIIAAHNYESHFGNIKMLKCGDEIILTDAEGKTLRYLVSETEVIPGDDAEDMFEGEWDLTLFTCNLSGKDRVTVRAVREYGR